MKSLLEEGLHEVLRSRSRVRPYIWRDASVPGALTAEAANMTWQQRRVPGLFTTIRQYAGVTLWSGALSMASYLLIVWVFSKAPIAGAAALRDTSSVFAVLIAMVFMKEAINRTKLLAVALAIAAIPLMRLS